MRDEVAPSFEDVLAMQRLLLAEMRELRLAVDGQDYRRRLICELGAAVGLGATCIGALNVALILQGVQEPPPAVESIVALLRGDPKCPRSDRQVLRILQAEAQRIAADNSAALCQWPPAG